jgi:hypothetical protein
MCLRFSQAELSVLKFAARQYIILLIFAVDAKRKGVREDERRKKRVSCELWISFDLHHSDANIQSITVRRT